jgi:uncharacterized protein YukE
MSGQRVCRMHGGSSPGAREAGERRQSVAQADATIKQLWVGLENADPVQDPVRSLTRLAGALEVFLDQVGGRVTELQHLSAGESLSQLRGEVVLWERTATLLARLLDSLARLNLDERQVRLAERHARWVVAAAEGGWSALAEHLVAAAVGLPPESREVFMRAFVAGLRTSAPAGELEAGAAS